MNASETDKAYTELKRLIIGQHNEVMRELGAIKSDVSQVKRDVNTIASEISITRDREGQLRRSA